MPSPRTYTTAGAFRRALEERLKRTSLTDQIDLNRLRRQVSFDRLLARLFREESAPWALKGGYALELRFKTARATVDIDLTLQRVVAGTPGTRPVARWWMPKAASRTFTTPNYGASDCPARRSDRGQRPAKSGCYCPRDRRERRATRDV